MQLAIFESKRMHEESQLFDLEFNFNSKFKSKLMSLNSEIINIEKNYLLEKELIEIIEENYDSKLDKKPNKVEISCALLVIFFSGRMTQHALSLVMKLVKILVKDDELPNLLINY